jgi:cytochrome bd-type quinol oxidase subunit 2
MINLIPPEALKEVKKEYWIRVFSVWAVLVGFAFLIIAILHVPVYHLLGTQKDSYQDAYTTANEQTSEFKIAEDSIKNANAVATLLTKKNEQTPFSYVIATIDSLVPNGVVIASYSLTRKDGGLSTIAISGVATGRSTLTSFKNAIENDPLFKVASIPLSDLTKDKDIPFTLTIMPNATSTKL